MYPYRIGFAECFTCFQGNHIRLLRNFFLETIIITSSHPWLQTYIRRSWKTPDAKVGKSFTFHGNIRRSIRIANSHPVNLVIVQNQRIMVKHMLSNVTTIILPDRFQRKLVFGAAVCSSSVSLNQKILQGFLALEQKFIIRLLCIF